MTRRWSISGAAGTAGGVVVGSSLTGSLTYGRAGATTGDSAGAAVRPRPPRTRLARAVQELLGSSSPRFLVQHCQRSFQLALLIAAAQGLDAVLSVGGSLPAAPAASAASAISYVNT